MIYYNSCLPPLDVIAFFHKITSLKDDDENIIIELLENSFTKDEIIIRCRILRF